VRISPFDRSRRAARIVAVIGTAIVTAGCAAASNEAAPSADAAASATPSFDPDSWHGPLLAEPLDLPELTLTDTSGETFDLRERTLGDPTLLFFGYTHCPDICPIHMSTIARAMDNVGLTTDDLDVVFVSNDPDRDTPEALDDFLDRFDPGFVGLTGDLDTIVAAMQTLQLPPPEFSAPTEDGAYFVGHAAQVIAFDADGQARIIYPFGVEIDAWEADLPKLVAGEQPQL
jgi:protein SCO1/2